MNNKFLLEFLIPAYKRLDGVVTAALSVANQVVENHYEGSVRISVVDDASPGFSADKLKGLLGKKADLVDIKANPVNKGMSLNIFDMVSNSHAEFCTILTDDDWLREGKLLEIVEYLRSISNKSEIAGLFTPRYSYLESGELHCVVCRPFSHDQLINSGPISSIKYAHNGFILTGFIFRPAYFSRQEWFDNIDNGYFPVINFGCILSRHSLLFVDRNWFHHTVLNVCYWESWGEDQLSQHKRLYRDYLDAVSFLARSFISLDIPSTSKSLISWYEFAHYLRQLKSHAKISLFSRINGVSQRTSLRLAFNVSVAFYPIYVPFNFAWRGFFYCVRFLKRVVSAEMSRLNL